MAVGTLLVAFAHATKAVPCKYTASNGVTYDLSSIAGKEVEWTGQDGPAEGIATFDFGICAAAPDCDGDSDTSACQHDKADGQLYTTGKLSTMKWLDVQKPDQGICFGLQYTGGTGRYCQQVSERSMISYFVCDPNATSPVLDRVEETFLDECRYLGYIRTALACPCGTVPPPMPVPVPPIGRAPYIRVGHAVPTTNTITVKITQGNLSVTWADYKYRQFSDWETHFAVGNGTIALYDAAGTLLTQDTRLLTPGPLFVVAKDLWPVRAPTQIYTVAASYVPPRNSSATSVRLTNLFVPQASPPPTVLSLTANRQSVFEGVVYPDATVHKDIAWEQGSTFALVDSVSGQTLASLLTTPPQNAAWGIWALGLRGSATYPIEILQLADAPEQLA